MSEAPPVVADRYRLDERIGAGGMGVVWRAHDLRLNRTVAVKQLLLGPGLSARDADESRARAMREGRIAARLQHPHAINVFDVALGPDLEGGEEHQPWLVLEYLPSRSLADVLDGGPLPPLEVARIGRQVADALAAAHRAGIVHRDVKPGNVLIGANGTVKITDFGIARATWDSTVTRTGVLAGTPAYFAPEVARGEAPDPASDVFSLGATLYTAVEGTPPFGQEKNALALLRIISEGHLRPPRNAGILSSLLIQMLRYDPAQRPEMAVSRDLLGRIAAKGIETPAAPPAIAEPDTSHVPDSAAPPEATPPQPVTDPQDRSWWQRRRVLAAVSVLLIAVAGIVLVLAFGGSEDSPTAAPTPTPATASATAATPAPSPEDPTGTEPTTTEPTSTTSVPPEAPGPEAFVQAVQTYYGLLPDRLDEAYTYLGPGVQEQAGGRSGYEDFWNDYSEVEGTNVQAEGTTVTLTIVYTGLDGATFTEPYVLEMGTAEDGRILILSSRAGGPG